MTSDYDAFVEWYEVEKLRTDWNFKQEMAKYCKMDVEILSRCVLKFRKLFKESLDVDPFRYVTLSSLWMSIYTNMFMPAEKIVGNSTGKNNVSLFSKEWLTWLEDKDVMREIPMYVDAAKYGRFERHKHKVPTDEDEQKNYYKDKRVFTVDGYNEKTNSL